MNTTTITLGGRAYALRASNFASQLYADEFYGRKRGEYNGTLSHDASQLLADCIGDVSEDGNIQVRFVSPSLWGIVWALAAAEGTVKVGYDEWMRSVRDELWTVQEQAEACVEVIGLMMRTFFREQQEPGSGVAEA